MKLKILFVAMIAFFIVSCCADREGTTAPCRVDKTNVGYGRGGWGKHRVG